MKKDTYFYVYITRHGVNSETHVIHTGYSKSNSNYYPTWYSEPITEEFAKKIYPLVHKYDGNEFMSRNEVIDIIKDLIKDSE